MAVRIKKVTKGGIAARYGLRAGDEIISINDRCINDFIDLQFYTVDSTLLITIRDVYQAERVLTIEDFWEGKLGIELEPYKVKSCTNNCIFCFIEQMPPQMRKPLYVKDDDYLYSFVFGNYISLNNLTVNEFNRITEQKISPLYISIHTTDPTLRAKIMGYSMSFDLLKMLYRLSEQGISFHTQIVLIPEKNDGDALLRTLNDLTAEGLNTLSVGIVPVGLTSFREKLPAIAPYTPAGAGQIITMVSNYCRCSNRNNIYLADEFFLLAGEDIPQDSYYADFCQIENGIGMTRATINNFTKKRVKFGKMLDDRSMLMVTGTLAAGMMQSFAGKLNKSAKSNRVSVLPVRNNFFGHTVTVSGLLTWSDVEKELNALQQLPEVLAFSSNMFNTDGVTIDDVHYSQIKEMLNREVLIIDELWNDWMTV